MLKVLEGQAGVSKKILTALPETHKELLITGALVLNACGATVSSLAVGLAGVPRS
jgi:hypothetical protein